jgi:DNA-directed RNA polymerase subunit RPC12/RpoP
MLLSYIDGGCTWADENPEHEDSGDLEIVDDFDTAVQDALSDSASPSPPASPPACLRITSPPSITERPELYAGSTQQATKIKTNYNPTIQYLTPAPVAAYEVTYMCGDCESGVMIKRGELNEYGEEVKADRQRCRACGCRYLYKKQAKRMMQFEAR